MRVSLQRGPVERSQLDRAHVGRDEGHLQFNDRRGVLEDATAGGNLDEVVLRLGRVVLVV